MTQPAEQEFVLTRTFDAPRELVFKAWTEAEHLNQWWGPKNFTVQTAKLDLRPGAVFHYCMRTPDCRDIWGKFVYREIALNHLTFTEQDGKTTITLRGAPINATPEEHKIFHDARPSMQQGFKGTLDQLAEHLAKETKS